MLTYLLFRLGTVIVPILPSWLTSGLAILVADLSFYLHRARRMAVCANLRRVVGDHETELVVRRYARSVFRTSALNYRDLFKLSRMKMEDLKLLFEHEGWHHFEESLKLGRGAIGVSAHLGNLDVIAQLAVVQGAPCTIPTEPIRPKRLLNLVTGLRAMRGLNIVPLDGSVASIKNLLQALRRNELVGIVADRDVLGSGLPVLFFGAITSIPTGPASLSLRTGAPIHPLLTLRRDDGSFFVRVGPPLILPRTGDPHYDLQRGTEIVAQALEKSIREAPDQWIVFERVWPEDDVDNGETQEVYPSERTVDSIGQASRVTGVNVARQQHDANH